MKALLFHFRNVLMTPVVLSAKPVLGLLWVAFQLRERNKAIAKGKFECSMEVVQ